MAFTLKDELCRRTKALAHVCVKLATSLPDTQLCRVISHQLIKSSTSSAANYRASCLAQSKAQLKAKLSIVIEELDETKFWTEFLFEEDLIDSRKADPIIVESTELLKVLISSRMTLQRMK